MNEIIMIELILRGQTKSAQSHLHSFNALQHGRRGDINFERCENRGTIFALFENFISPRAVGGCLYQRLVDG